MMAEFTLADILDALEEAGLNATGAKKPTLVLWLKLFWKRSICMITGVRQSGMTKIIMHSIGEMHFRFVPLGLY